MSRSPRMTRSLAATFGKGPQAVAFVEGEGEDEDSELVPEVSTPRLAHLPSDITPSHTGLRKRDHALLKRKQAWLTEYSITLPRQFEKYKQAVDATLVFAQEEAGTAVCISPEGLLLTCSHCIAESEEEWDKSQLHWLLFRSGRAVGARCVAWDARRDLALLRVVAAQPASSTILPSTGLAASSSLDKEARERTINAFAHATLSSSSPPLGSRLVCVGHPGSEDLEASQPGIKTNYDVLHVSTGYFRGCVGDPQDNSAIGALMHDAWTYWGHSGAPLFDRKTGCLVGLHSSWDDDTAMRHGIPLEAIRKFVDESSSLLSVHPSAQ